MLPFILQSLRATNLMDNTEIATKATAKDLVDDTTHCLAWASLNDDLVMARNVSQPISTVERHHEAKKIFGRVAPC